MSIPVLQLMDADTSGRRRWDAFVYETPDATFFHRSGWQRVIGEAFGHRCWFYYTEQGGRISAILPLAEIRSRLFGHALVSLPFCVYGGVAGACERSRTALVDAARALARKLGVRHLELRRLQAAEDGPEWHGKDLYYTFRKPICASDEANLTAIPRKQRAVVRKGIALGLRSEIDADAGRFFPVYAGSVHRLGTPVFGRRYFQLLKEEFGDDCELRVIGKDGHALAAVMSFFFRNEVLPYYGGGVPQARSTAAYDFMYWSLMRDAAARGCTIFDFGRSKRGTGAFDFKKNWGFAPAPLPYAYWLNTGASVPDVNPLNPRYKLLIAAWRRLPLALANAIGPHIARDLG
ncbi:FemAB family XrtA/PEP-CTERM system-associated protein [Massilia endophytica]|uniref:FemAB family XrtA/PEP-CTERM system-associated protein n=1 Tax=Massilia endophytica TaxID=2899220 RepID=UPI001E4E6E71|nr:FemAB family XrtA/PEP-CTERM system-associated protein [Massilia endophytica]UGQ46215.1 FemAB family PEP-CTERM system-associated protein [Massilia endophytica]